MSFRLSAAIHRLGEPMENRHIGHWKDEWTNSAHGEVKALATAAGDLWRFLEQHGERAKQRSVEKASGKGENWRDRMRMPGDSLSRDVARVRTAIRNSFKLSNVASELADKALKRTTDLLPFDPTEQGAADAVTRASIRQRLATMPKEERAAYIKRKDLDNRTVRAILEVDPEMSGFDAGSMTFKGFRERVMQERHGPVLAAAEQILGAAEYVTNLAAAVQRAGEAEAIDFGLRVDEVSDFIADALQQAA